MKKIISTVLAGAACLFTMPALAAYSLVAFSKDEAVVAMASCNNVTAEEPYIYSEIAKMLAFEQDHGAFLTMGVPYQDITDMYHEYILDPPDVYGPQNMIDYVYFVYQPRAEYQQTSAIMHDIPYDFDAGYKMGANVKGYGMGLVLTHLSDKGEPIEIVAAGNTLVRTGSEQLLNRIHSVPEQPEFRFRVLEAMTGFPEAINKQCSNRKVQATFAFLKYGKIGGPLVPIIAIRSKVGGKNSALDMLYAQAYYPFYFMTK